MTLLTVEWIHQLRKAQGMYTHTQPNDPLLDCPSAPKHPQACFQSASCHLLPCRLALIRANSPAAVQIWALDQQRPGQLSQRPKHALYIMSATLSGHKGLGPAHPSLWIAPSVVLKWLATKLTPHHSSGSSLYLKCDRPRVR